MKKLIVITALILLLITPVITVFPALAATTDFTANSDITVASVTFGNSTANMLILNGSTAENWTFNSGTFTVTNPGTAFKIGSSDSSVKSIIVKDSGSTNVACSENTTPGTSYVTLPTTSDTYTIEPSTITDCTALCTALANTATYNSFPTCGAATCNTGYFVSGSGSSAICVAAGGGGGTLTTITEEPTVEETKVVEKIIEQKDIITETPNIQTDARMMQWQQVLIDASAVYAGDVNLVLTNVGLSRDLSIETSGYIKYTKPLIKGMNNLIATNINAITNFVVYGTKGTQILGAGERAGVVNSYKSAFNKLPSTESEWKDCIAIANGRWPGERNKQTEANAEAAFEKIYLRKPDRSNPHDDAAVTVIAYGLRPANRNLNSEKAAIRIFKAIYGYDPLSATAWDIVRAIAYSGATR